MDFFSKLFVNVSDHTLIMWGGFLYSVFLGAAVGSFLNVVIYRMPEGKSLWWPPSSCRRCGRRLKLRDNMPVLAWLWLRGKCRFCGEPISWQYPMVEAVTIALFAGWFSVCYLTGLRPDFGGQELHWTGSFFLVYCVLLGGLIGATLIDARYFIIPLAIPWFITGVAIVALPPITLLPKHEVEVKLPTAVINQVPVSVEQRLKQVPDKLRRSAELRVALERGQGGSIFLCVAPRVSNRVALGAFCGMAGLIVAVLLLLFKLLPRSFDEPVTADPLTQDPYQWLAHPHPRREMLKECLFLSLPLAGFLIGVLAIEAPLAPWPEWVQTLGGVLMGYLGGGAIVWLVRILGTLGFGKEAMGLGDVHLMAAVGAVCGWQVAIVAFFIAPFFGLSWAVLALLVGKLRGKEIRMIPYGPHLAVATAVVVVFREAVFSTHFGRLLMMLTSP